MCIVRRLVRQVTAPPTVPLAGASEDAMAGGSRAWPQAMQTAVYMQVGGVLYGSVAQRTA